MTSLTLDYVPDIHYNNMNPSSERINYTLRDLVENPLVVGGDVISHKRLNYGKPYLLLSELQKLAQIANQGMIFVMGNHDAYVVIPGDYNFEIIKFPDDFVNALGEYLGKVSPNLSVNYMDQYKRALVVPENTDVLLYFQHYPMNIRDRRLEEILNQHPEYNILGVVTAHTHNDYLTVQTRHLRDGKLIVYLNTPPFMKSNKQFYDPKKRRKRTQFIPVGAIYPIIVDNGYLAIEERYLDRRGDINEKVLFEVSIDDNDDIRNRKIDIQKGVLKER